MKKLFFFILLISTLQANAQVTLEQCYEGLKNNFPSLQTKEFLHKQYNREIGKLSNNWLPQINLNANVTYQSDVTKVDVTMPEIQIPGLGQSFQIPDLNIPTPDKDQYKVNFEISQMIYDGGVISAQKSIRKSSFDLNIQNLDIKLQDLKANVNQIYFGIITLDKSIELIDLTLKSLNEKRKVLKSLVDNGVLINSELKNFDSEILKIQQQKLEMIYNRKTLIKSLSILTGLDINDNTIFTIPNEELTQSNKIETPKHKLFEIQKSLNNSSNELKQTTIYPKIFAFAQAGYGKPGLNMLSNEFNPFYIVGIQFKWTLWDWNSSNFDSQITELNNQLIDKNKESYDLQLQTELIKELNNIEKLEKIIKNDKDIVNLKSEIVQSSNSKLENGIINSADYINDVNNELKAKIELELHKFQKLQSIINYNTLLGK